MIEVSAMQKQKDTPRVFAAIHRPTGEFWNFQLGDWVNDCCSNCFSSNPDVVRAYWGKDDSSVDVFEYKLTQVRVYRERNEV